MSTTTCKDTNDDDHEILRSKNDSVVTSENFVVSSVKTLQKVYSNGVNTTSIAVNQNSTGAIPKRHKSLDRSSYRSLLCRSDSNSSKFDDIKKKFQKQLSESSATPTDKRQSLYELYDSGPLSPKEIFDNKRKSFIVDEKAPNTSKLQRQSSLRKPSEKSSYSSLERSFSVKNKSYIPRRHSVTLESKSDVEKFPIPAKRSLVKKSSNQKAEKEHEDLTDKRDTFFDKQATVTSNNVDETKSRAESAAVKDDQTLDDFDDKQLATKTEKQSTSTDSHTTLAVKDTTSNDKPLVEESTALPEEIIEINEDKNQSANTLTKNDANLNEKSLLEESTSLTEKIVEINEEKKAPKPIEEEQSGEEAATDVEQTPPTSPLDKISYLQSQLACQLPKHVVEELKNTLTQEKVPKKKVQFHPDVVFDKPIKKQRRKLKSPQLPSQESDKDTQPCKTKFLYSGPERFTVNDKDLNEDDSNDDEYNLDESEDNSNENEDNSDKNENEKISKENDLDENANLSLGSEYFYKKFDANRRNIEDAIKRNSLSPTPQRQLPKISEETEEHQEIELVYSNIQFSQPEARHIIERASSSEDSEIEIVEELENFVMDSTTKVKKKKRSSFFNIFKKKSSGKKEQEVHTDNARNETNFNRNVPQRHTFDAIRNKNDVVVSNGNVIDSSSSTLNSDNNLDNYSHQRLQKTNWNIETPPRSSDTRQNIQLVNPKAAIPINSERPLPNPYQEAKQHNLVNSKPKLNNLNVPYGTYDLKSVPAQLVVSSPKSSSLERSKLKLPSHREKIDLQPRIKSPIPETKISTDKIIATELLKKSSNTKNDSFESTTSYDSGSTKSIQQHLEAGEWQKKQNELAKLPPIVYPNQQIVTNATVHVDSPIYLRNSQQALNAYPKRASTPLSMLSTSSLQASPKKEEIRQHVEAYFWKEIKKLKEAEDMKLQEIHLSKEADLFSKRNSMPNLSIRKTMSLPRELRHTPRVTVQEPLPQQQSFVRVSPLSRTAEMSDVRPIFRRGSLYPEDYQAAQQQSYKKVSFSAQNPNNLQSWPTRNGFTQSPPQRKLLDMEYYDDVFLPDNTPSRRRLSETDGYSGRPPVPPARRQRIISYSDIRSPLPDNRTTIINENRVPNDILVRSNQPNMKPIQEPLYGTRRTYVDNAKPIYGQIQDQLYVPREAIYGPNRQITESPYGSRQDFYYHQKQPPQNEPLYGQKQVTVTNRVCDIYGRIHDVPSKFNPQETGVIYGQLQRSPTPALPPHNIQLSNNFVRGSRLTSSANDMYKRLDPRYDNRDTIYIQRHHQPQQMDNSQAPNRPLPPIPIENKTKFLLSRRASLRNERKLPHQSPTEVDSYNRNVMMNQQRNTIDARTFI